jgi:SAM-dependent methyltransferase
MALGSIEALPLASSSVDVVTCFDVLYHREVTAEAEALAEFWRVLCPGGQLLIRVPAYGWLHGAHDDAVHTRRRYTRNEIVSAVASAGFAVTMATYGNSTLLPLAVMKRLSERWLGPSQVEMTVPPAAVNACLTSILRLEASWVRRWTLPFGLSVFVLARKPAGVVAPACGLALAS